MSDEQATKQIIEDIERNLAAWKDGDGYRGGYDFDAERGMVNDLRTLLEIAKTALENVTIDVLGRRANGHNQDRGRHVTPGWGQHDSRRCAQRAHADDQRDSPHRHRPALHREDHPPSEGSRP